MEIKGREYGFSYTVGAEEELARMCPNEDIRQLGAVLKRQSAEGLRARAKLMCVLSRWHERARHFEAPEYVEQPLTLELIELLPPPVFARLEREALQAIARDTAVKVEAAPGKKGEAPA